MGQSQSKYPPGHVRLNIQFCLIWRDSAKRLFHNACEMALHPSCAKITQAVMFPNTRWLSSDRRCTTLGSPHMAPSSWRRCFSFHHGGSEGQHLHLEIIDKWRLGQKDNIFKRKRVVFERILMNKAFMTDRIRIVDSLAKRDRKYNLKVFPSTLHFSRPKQFPFTYLSNIINQFTGQ